MTTTDTYRVAGMTCEHCAAAVNDELSALGGVTDVTVHLVPGGTSTVTVASTTPLDSALVAEAINEAGYALAGPRDLPMA